MYSKIYKSMLFICTTVLITVLVIMLLVCYTTFKNLAENDFEEASKEASVILSTFENMQEGIDKLNSVSVYNYDFLSDNALCNENHYCAVISIKNKGFLHISQPFSKMYAPFYPVLFFAIFIGILMFLFSLRLATALTDSVVKPFSELLSTDSADTYAEILPLTRAIEFQNEEIKRQTENAQAREVELQLITDNMNEGLIIADKNGCILSINNFALKIFNAEIHNVIHKSFSSLIPYEAFTVSVEKALKGSRSNAVIELGESYFRVYCSPILKSGVSDGVIILLFDITSTYQSEKLRREFSANVSHELKTPLTSINGYSQIISSGIAKSEDIPEFAGKIAKESNRLMILIEDIMRLSNLDEGAPSEPDSTVSVKEIVTDVLSSLQEKAEKRNISVFCEGENFTVTANKTQLNELLYNICDNAIKYNKDNGSVNVRLCENSVFISDTGIGIPQEYTTRIFERFFRVDKSHSKKVDGTGLGLSIVKHIAKQNNIEIEVESRLGEGSTFKILFCRKLL